MPDISKWDISKVKTMNNIFCNCESLTSLPDLFKWNIYKNNMLFGCNKKIKLMILNYKVNNKDNNEDNNEDKNRDNNNNMNNMN